MHYPVGETKKCVVEKMAPDGWGVAVVNEAHAVNLDGLLSRWLKSGVGLQGEELSLLLAAESADDPIRERWGSERIAIPRHT